MTGNGEKYVSMMDDPDMESWKEIKKRIIESGGIEYSKAAAVSHVDKSAGDTGYFSLNPKAEEFWKRLLFLLLIGISRSAILCGVDPVKFRAGPDLIQEGFSGNSRTGN